MPRYEYLCPNCGVEVTRVRPMVNVNKTVECPNEDCGVKMVLKMSVPSRANIRGGTPRFHR
jgi:putative FmdB family regulatory protein